MSSVIDRAPKFADEAAIRALYKKLIESWELGVSAYAECFAPDTTYIVGNGMIEQGWQEIVDGHEIIFSAWARNSRLEGRIDRLQFLLPDIALIVASGHIVYKDHRSSDANKRTVYSLIAQKAGGEWQFVFYQNTPIAKH
jgi:uncharacterized protein (TIGR02246 family)